MRYSRSLLFAASLWAFFSACGDTHSSGLLSDADKVSTLAPGITKISRVTATPMIIQAIKIDLTVPENKIHSTRSIDRRITTSKFAQKYRCSVAINADFFQFSDYSTIGLAVGEGEQWPGSKDTATWGTLVINKNNEARLAAPAEVVPFSDDIFAAVGGQNWLVEDGKIVQPACAAGDGFCQRHPRTAVGLSGDGKTLIMVAVEGRSSASKGASLPELADIMVSLGAARALNLDGGGSTAMVVNGEHQVRHSDPNERVVANHLGVCQGPIEAQGTGTLIGVTYTGGDTAKRVAGVKVTLSGGQSVLSDANGVYRFEGLKPGNHIITFEKDGLATKTLSRDVAETGETWGSINL